MRYGSISLKDRVLLNCIFFMWGRSLIDSNRKCSFSRFLGLKVHQFLFVFHWFKASFLLYTSNSVLIKKFWIYFDKIGVVLSFYLNFNNKIEIDKPSAIIITFVKCVCMYVIRVAKVLKELHINNCKDFT